MWSVIIRDALPRSISLFPENCGWAMITWMPFPDNLWPTSWEVCCEMGCLSHITEVIIDGPRVMIYINFLTTLL